MHLSIDLGQAGQDQDHRPMTLFMTCEGQGHNGTKIQLVVETST